MEIKEVKLKEDDGFEYRNGLELSVNGNSRLVFLDGEPEDANLRRDFSDVYKIADLLKEVYEAGKKGEPFELVRKTVNDIEDF